MGPRNIFSGSDDARGERLEYGCSSGEPSVYVAER